MKARAGLELEKASFLSIQSDKLKTKQFRINRTLPTIWTDSPSFGEGWKEGGRGVDSKSSVADLFINSPSFFTLVFPPPSIRCFYGGPSGNQCLTAASPAVDIREWVLMMDWYDWLL
jgi:hypothetical protein